MTVCPPEDTSTNLNPDLVNVENDALDNDTRDDLVEMAADWLEDLHFRDVMDDLRMMKEENRFSNWYHGYTKVELPYKRHLIGTNVWQPMYNIETTALASSVASPLFNQDFTGGFRPYLEASCDIHLPDDMGANITMVVDIELDTKDTAGGDEYVRIFRG